MSLFLKIKSISTRKGLSIRKIEHEAGLSNGTIRNWDNVNPSAYSVKAVADVLGISVDELLKEDELIK